MWGFSGVEAFFRAFLSSCCCNEKTVINNKQCSMSCDTLAWLTSLPHPSRQCRLLLDMLKHRKKMSEKNKAKLCTFCHDVKKKECSMCLIDFFPAIDFTLSYRASQQPSIPTKMCIDDVKTKYVLTAIRFQSFLASYLHYFIRPTRHAAESLWKLKNTAARRNTKNSRVGSGENINSQSIWCYKISWKTARYPVSSHT